jgi:putative SOS response-associated peptidase YedK
MCGRYTLTNPDPVKLRQRFLVGESATEFEPRFNVAPTDAVPAVRLAEGGERELGRLRWGLVPGRWAAKRSGRPLINARVESLTSQPAFAESFRERRCLIPADGFYEWRTDEQGKTPCWITLRGGGLFAFAGIWAAIPARASARDGEGEELHTCALLTGPPNDLVRQIHDRMPVILAPDAEAGWLDPERSEEELLELAAPLDSELLEVREVPDLVNDVRNDDASLIEPRAAAQLF